MQVVFNKDFKNLYYKNITPLKYFQLALILLMFSFIINGCGLTKDYVVLSYDPQVNVEKIKGAESTKLKVEISDVRTIKDKVSNKINSDLLPTEWVILVNLDCWKHTSEYLKT